jgi:glutaconate CoA-transferase subunit A
MTALGRCSQSAATKWKAVCCDSGVLQVTTLREAIAQFVHDGDRIALEGFSHLVPFAAGHEIIRQRRRNLTLIRLSADLIYDQMIGIGCAKKLIFSWAGNPGFGLLHRFRDAVENRWPRPLELEEYTHAALAVAFAAGAARLPFGILRGDPRNDLFKYTSAFAPITCPFTREDVTAVRAIRPDVTIIHAQRADKDSNVQLWGIVGIQKEAVLAAEKVIVTVEEICEQLDPVTNGIVIPSWVIHAIVHAPGGARPSYVHGYYGRNDESYREWDAIARNRDRFLQWMEENVLEYVPV